MRDEVKGYGLGSVSFCDGVAGKDTIQHQGKDYQYGYGSEVGYMISLGIHQVSNYRWNVVDCRAKDWGF